MAQAAFCSLAGSVVSVRFIPGAADGENQAERRADSEHGQRRKPEPAPQIARRRNGSADDKAAGGAVHGAWPGWRREIMNYSLTILETAVIASGLGVLLLDLWAPVEQKRQLGYAAAAALGFILLFSFSSYVDVGATATAFNGMYVQDGLALFFKRFFLIAAILVLIVSVEFADRIATGISEYYALILFALSGMMFAASANDFSLLFVSVELITVTFSVLTIFQRNRLASLEAGVKYLILGALSSAFMIFGIALVFGTTGRMHFTALAATASQFSANKFCLLGL